MIAKHGDRVRIKTPRVFARTGYDNNFVDAAAAVESGRAEAIRAFLRSMGLADDKLYLAFGKIVTAVGYALVKQRGFRNGDRRKIYTLFLPEYQGYTGTVEKVRFCKTGIYRPARRTGLEGDEYEPAYLENEQTHRILDVRIDQHYFTIRIEAANCEPVLEVPSGVPEL